MDNALLREAESTHDQLRRLEVEAERQRLEFHRAVRRLHSAGPSMREIASVLGLSHQRVHQIVSGGKEMVSPLLNRMVPRSRKEREPSRASTSLENLFDNRFYTDAREAMSSAEEEARAMNHGYLGTEHLLLGLLRTERGLAARLLRAAGVDLDRSRAMVQNLLGAQLPPPDDRRSATRRVKQVLELANNEAKLLRSTHVRSEHLLLGLAREGRGLGARVLEDFGIGYEHIRARINRADVFCSFCGRSGLDVAHLAAGPGVFICDSCVDAAGTQPGAGETGQSSTASVTVVSQDDPTAACSFCGKRVAAVERLVTARSEVSICNECLALCRQIQSEEREDFRPGRG